MRSEMSLSPSRKKTLKENLKKQVVEVIFTKYPQEIEAGIRDMREIEKNISMVLEDFSERTCLKVKALHLSYVGDGRYKLTMEVE